ncbi:hypothetical protein Tsubulata_034771 [Turnera subulata]|uniref:Fe2OG dioxygenase domain-containing protein n=1 Tax=Turnera subulata TaxID=218843 RepID=A0A9Q0J391_9ROSI|nr:hypothetical protein Tsubulata_034771 [Turnera subulata]
MGTQVDKTEDYGGSIPVDNVQALASKNLKDIPSRYIRPENELDEISEDESLQIPVIDMDKLVGPNQSGHEDELSKLHFACKEWGFFQLTNHGVPQEVIEKMKVDVQEFFKLPLEKKLAYAQIPNSIEGYGQAFVVSDEQKLDWGDMLFLIAQPVYQRNMRFWPSVPHTFRETLDRYSSELQRTTEALLRLMAENLGLDPEELASQFDKGTQGVRINYYPPCEQANKVMGLTPHSDATALTLLLQVTDVLGLQIKKNGKWVPIKPIPGAFIINVGDIIEIMSNGKYRSIEHRAVVNPEKERLSVAAFHSPVIKATLCEEMGTQVDKIADFGASFPVDNVQALASMNLNDIPSRYIIPENEFDEISVDGSLQIPVIDMSKLVGPNQSGHEDELSKLHFACKEWGFFQLINHGMPKEAIENMKVDVQEFFKLPQEEKMSYARLPNSMEGYGQALVVSEEEKLEWSDRLFLTGQPVSQRNMRFWPTVPHSFRATLDRYSSELQKTHESLLRLMAVNLGLDPEELVSQLNEGRQGIRINYYPPCVQANKVIGATPHSDPTALTLLLQVNDVLGLQIKKDSKWVPIRPIPNALIINVGDIIEIMSNGEYRSIEHRAVVNPEKERVSVAAFHSPGTKAIVGPLPDLVKKSTANYKSISHEEYIRLIFSKKLEGKSLIDHMKSEK